MRDSFLHVTLSYQSVPQITLHLCDVGLYLKSPPIIRNRFAELPRLQQRTGKVVVGNVIARSNIDRMPPQRLAIQPI